MTSSAGQAHQVVGTARPKTGLGIIAVDTPISTTVATAARSATTRRRRGQDTTAPHARAALGRDDGRTGPCGMVGRLGALASMAVLLTSADVSSIPPGV